MIPTCPVVTLDHYFYRVVHQTIEYSGRYAAAGCLHQHATIAEAWKCPSKIDKVAEVIEMPDNRPGCRSFNTTFHGRP